MAILAALVLFCSEHYLHTLGLMTFSNPLFPIAGMPLFHLVYGAGAGMVLIASLRKYPNYRFRLVCLFTLVHQLLNLFSEKVANHMMVGTYTIFHHLWLDFLSIVLVVASAETFLSLHAGFVCVQTNESKVQLDERRAIS